MDEILKSEVIVVVLERKEGVSFEEFAGLFHQVHGYQLKLTNYGYKSLKDLLDNMKDEVELQNINGQVVIKCRQPNQPNVISPQQNGPNISETCSASSNICWPQSGDIPLDEFPTEQTSCQQNAPVIRCYKSLPPAKQSTLQTQDHFTSKAYSTKDTCLTRKQMPSKEIVKIITRKIRNHPGGLRAAKLREYILEQHKIDLELSSQELGYTDMLSMLKQIPAIRFLNTSGKNVIIPSYMYKNLSEEREIPSAKTELLKVDPPSTSRSTSSAKHSAQLDDSSQGKKAKKEHLCSMASQSQENGPIISETHTASLHEPGSKTDHLFSRINNHAQHVSSHKDPTPTLLMDSNSAKQKRINTTKKSFQFISEKVTDVLRLFPSGLKVEKLTQHMKNKYKIDLMKHSQENGCTDMIEMLQKTPGITVVNKNVIVASDVYKMSNSKSNATCKTMPGKFPTNAGARVTKNLYVQRETKRGIQTVTKLSTTRSSGTGQQTSLPITSHRIPLTTGTINRPQDVQPGLRPNVSYASACASNLRKDQINVHTLQHSFNVQKAHTARAAQPNYKEIPKGVLPSSEIKLSLQLVLKSNANGLSIFQLKKLYLLQFQQPLVPKGSSARKFLMDMKDVAKIKGVGVQMKVFPVLSEDDLSASASIYGDSASQGTAALVANDGKNNEVLTLPIENSIEHIKHSVPMPLLKHQPSSSGFSHTELTGGHVLTSSSENISQKQPFHHSHNQPITESYGKTFYRTDISHSANDLFALSSQFSKMNESPPPALNVRNLSDAQWPSLPKKLSILKEIKQRPKVSEQLHEIMPSNELHFIQNSAATSQPQVKESSAQTLLQAHQNACKANGNIDSKQKEPQTSDLVHPILQSGFSFVMEDTGFSFVRGEKNVDKDKKSMEVALAGDPPITFTNSAHVGFELSGVDGRGNTHATPLQPNQSAHCKMAAQIKGSAPDAIRKAVNVSEQKMTDLSSKELPQQTNNHLVSSEPMGSMFSKPNQKTQSAKCEFPETGFTSLQAEGIQPSYTSGQMVSMPPKEQREASNSKRIRDFGKRESTPSPLKQEVAKSNLSNRCGVAVSPRSQSPEKASESKTIVGTQNIPEEKSLSGAQTTGNVKPVSSPVSQIQQKAEHTLHKDMNIVNGQIGLKTQNIEHSQTRNSLNGATASLSSAQEKSNTGQIYTHEERVTKPEQTKPKVPHPHTSPSMESRFSPETHNYCNGTDNRAPQQKERLTSQSYQHVSHSPRSVEPGLSAFSIPPRDQQDSLDNSSEESTRTWQTDSEQSCCIL